jgi:hypothetical protein
MSLKIMAEVWKLPFVNVGEKLLLLAIADHCNDEGMCFPSAVRLQKKCGWKSTATYSKHIKILKEAGLIRKTPRASTLEGRKTDVIRMNLSSFHTCKDLDRLRAARRKFGRKNTIFSHVQNEVIKQKVKPPSFHTVKDKPLALCQGKKYRNQNKPNMSQSDFRSKCLEIASELDNKFGVTK